MEAGLAQVDEVTPDRGGRHDLVPVASAATTAGPAGRGAHDQTGDPHEAASRARSSSTTDGSSLVNTGVGLSTFAPTATGADSQRGVPE